MREVTNNTCGITFLVWGLTRSATIFSVIKKKRRDKILSQKTGKGNETSDGKVFSIDEEMNKMRSVHAA